MKISQIWAVGNSCAGNFREFSDSRGPQYSRAGKFPKSRDIREIHENFLHANIWCSTVFERCAKAIAHE